MEKIAVSLLLSLSAMLGVNTVPETGSHWAHSGKWEKEGNYFIFSATNSSVSSQCAKNPKGVLQTPMIIHGVHQIFGDGILIHSSGDRSFKSTSAFYGAPSINCEIIQRYKDIKWVAYGYSKYFSRFNHFPKVQKNANMATFQSVTMNVISAGALIMLAIFSAVVFFNKVSKSLAFNIIGSCIFFSMYFMSVTLSHFPIDLPMIFSHKIADLALWIAAFFFINGLLEKKVIGDVSFKIFLAAAGFAILLIVFGTNGDIVQLGTTIPFPVVMLLLIRALFGEWKKFKEDRKTANLLHFISVLTFTLAAHYDIMVVTGVIDGFPVFSMGVLFAIFTLTLAVNDQITLTYRERDSLLHSLEEKVEEKTMGLQQALAEKEQAQAELIQNAKLASLGTLSAGIAHEINNSINYVNGAIQPLEKILDKAQLEDKEKQTMVKLLKSIKDGSKMTVEIVRSLRNYTGINQAKYYDVFPHEVAENVLTILRNKYHGRILIKNEIPEELSFYANKVGLNQIMMNLISNAIDAIGNEGEITLAAFEEKGTIHLSIKDNGPGISKEIQDRIFDPFFTTKDVGKGTGLGLHIVKSEIENHQGKISISSEPGQGTEFTIEIPRSSNLSTQGEAA